MIIRLLLVVTIAGFFHDLPAIALILRAGVIPNQPSRRSTNDNCCPALKFSGTYVSDNDGSHRGDPETIRRTKSNLVKKEWNKNYDLHLRALLHFKELHQSYHVAKNFSIPVQCSDWPSETWGLKLGNFVTKLKSRRTPTQISKKLMEIRLALKPEVARSPRRDRFELVMIALLWYQKLNGDMLVKSKFVVPDSPDWPPEVRGLKLGFITTNIRRGSSYSDKRKELTAIGFVFESQHKYGYDLIREALVRYKELNGHINVPARFSIPEDCTRWPAQLRGIKLGTVAHDIRRGTYGDKRDDILSLGFKYAVRKKFDYDCVKIAIFKFRELNHGSTKVPRVYNIPDDDPWYPEETWGMFLGSTANRIRCGLIYQDKHDELFGS